MQFFLYDSLKKEKNFHTELMIKIKSINFGPKYIIMHMLVMQGWLFCDLLIRVLRTIYKNVKFVSNITDIDDKIIEASIKSNIPIKNITDKFSKIYNQDMAGY